MEMSKIYIPRESGFDTTFFLEFLSGEQKGNLFYNKANSEWYAK